MRIAKNTTVTLTEAPTSRFLLVVDLMDGDVILQKKEKTVLSLSLSGDDVLATLCYPDGRVATLLGTDARKKEVILTAGYARVGLYVGGVLLDEDFFFTPLDYLGATVHAGSFMHFEAGYEYHAMSESAIVENLADRIDGYRPVGTDYGVLRPLPTVVGGRLHLFYLDERHGGRAKDGRGAHKLCALFSDDGKTFHGAPIALPIDNVREEDIRDASLLCHEGRYYLYYIVKYEGGASLSCAVSEDGFSYQKTGLDIEIAGVNNRTITSVTLLSGATPTIYFTAEGKAYQAESIDLLHFAAPEALPALDGTDKLLPAAVDGTITLYAQRNGALLRLDGRALANVCAAPPYAVPVTHVGKHFFIGVRAHAIVTSYL